MTKYIELEEAIKYIISLHIHKYECLPVKSGFGIDKNEVIEGLNNLPTIDPIATIDEMIEEYTGTQIMTDPLIVCAFQELKSRLLANSK